MNLTVFIVLLAAISCALCDVGPKVEKGKKGTKTEKRDSSEQTGNFNGKRPPFGPPAQVQYQGFSPNAGPYVVSPSQMSYTKQDGGVQYAPSSIVKDGGVQYASSAYRGPFLPSYNPGVQLQPKTPSPSPETVYPSAPSSYSAVPVQYAYPQHHQLQQQQVQYYAIPAEAYQQHQQVQPQPQQHRFSYAMPSHMIQIAYASPQYYKQPMHYAAASVPQYAHIQYVQQPTAAARVHPNAVSYAETPQYYYQAQAQPQHHQHQAYAYSIQPSLTRQLVGPQPTQPAVHYQHVVPSSPASSHEPATSFTKFSKTLLQIQSPDNGHPSGPYHHHGSVRISSPTAVAPPNVYQSGHGAGGGLGPIYAPAPQHRLAYADSQASNYNHPGASVHYGTHLYHPSAGGVRVGSPTPGSSAIVKYP